MNTPKKGLALCHNEAIDIQDYHFSERLGVIRASSSRLTFCCLHSLQALLLPPRRFRAIGWILSTWHPPGLPLEKSEAATGRLFLVLARTLLSGPAGGVTKLPRAASSFAATVRLGTGSIIGSPLGTGSCGVQTREYDNNGIVRRFQARLRCVGWAERPKSILSVTNLITKQGRTSYVCRMHVTWRCGRLARRPVDPRVRGNVVTWAKAILGRWTVLVVLILINPRIPALSVQDSFPAGHTRFLNSP